MVPAEASCLARQSASTGETPQRRKGRTLTPSTVSSAATTSKPTRGLPRVGRSPTKGGASPIDTCVFHRLTAGIARTACRLSNEAMGRLTRRPPVTLEMSSCFAVPDAAAALKPGPRVVLVPDAIMVRALRRAALSSDPARGQLTGDIGWIPSFDTPELRRALDSTPGKGDRGRRESASTWRPSSARSWATSVTVLASAEKLKNRGSVTETPSRGQMFPGGDGRLEEDEKGEADDTFVYEDASDLGGASPGPSRWSSRPTSAVGRHGAGDLKGEFNHRPSSNLRPSTATPQGARGLQRRGGEREESRELPVRPLSATPLRDGKRGVVSDRGGGRGGVASTGAKGGDRGGGGGISGDLDAKDEWLHINRRGPLGRYQSHDRLLESSPWLAKMARVHEANELRPSRESESLVSKAQTMFQARMDRVGRAMSEKAASEAAAREKALAAAAERKGKKVGKDTRKKLKDDEEDNSLSAETIYGLAAIKNAGGGRRQVKTKIHEVALLAGAQSRRATDSPAKRWGAHWESEYLALDRNSLKKDLKVHMPKSAATRRMEEDQSRVMDVLWRQLSSDGLKLILGRSQSIKVTDDDVDADPDDDFLEIVEQLVAGEDLSFGKDQEERQEAEKVKAEKKKERAGRLPRGELRNLSLGNDEHDWKQNELRNSPDSGATATVTNDKDNDKYKGSGVSAVTSTTIAYFPRFYRASGSKLTHLILSDSFPGSSDKAMSLLTTSLQAMLTVTHLELERCGIGSSGAPSGCACLMELMIKERRRADGSGLKHLSLAGNPIGDLGVEALALGINANETLKRLVLSKCKISERGAAKLGVALQNNSCIEHLSLSWNNIGEKGGQFIAEAIGTSPSLVSVDLENCALGPEGTDVIGYAIRENDTLQALNMSANRLDTKAGIVLAESLRRNDQLRVLMLRRNPIGFEGAKALVKELVDGQDTLVDLLYCTFHRSNTIKGFDEQNPAGTYYLDLAEQLDYQIAEILVGLAIKQGPQTWQNAKYLGARINIKDKVEKHDWPKRMPVRGHLWVEFSPTDLDGVEVSELTAKQFDLVWRHIVSRNQRKLTDEWIIEYASVLANVEYFTAAQVLEMSRAVEWSSSRVRLVLTTFSSIIDPSNTDVLEQGMLAQEWDACLDSLGNLASFTPANPTGRYSLNLSRQLDHAVLTRLKVMYINEAEEGLCGTSTECAFRNMKLNGEEIKGMENGRATVAAIRAWEIPISGTLEFDFVSFRSPLPCELRLESFEYFMELLMDCTPETARKVWGKFNVFDTAEERKAAANKKFALILQKGLSVSKLTAGLQNDVRTRITEGMVGRSTDARVDMLNDALKTVCSIDRPEERLFKKGSIILKAGSPNDYAYYFTKGQGEVYKPALKASSNVMNNRPIAAIRVGNFTGEVEILMGEPCYFATIKASEDSWVTVIEREDLLRIFDSDHPLAAHLATAVEEKHCVQIRAMMATETATALKQPLQMPYKSFTYYYNRALGRQGSDRQTSPPLLKVSAGTQLYKGAAVHTIDTAYFVMDGNVIIEAEDHDVHVETGVVVGRFYWAKIVPGMCVGLVSMLMPREKYAHHTVKLQCTTAATLIPMDVSLLNSMLEMFPEIGKLLKQEAERVSEQIVLCKIEKEQELLAKRAAEDLEREESKNKTTDGEGVESQHGHQPVDLHEAMSGPPSTAGQARLMAVRRMTSQRNLTPFHVIKMLGSGLFPESAHRVELAVTCFHAFKDRDSFGEVLYAMRQKEQVATARRLGYKNIFSWRRPNLHYHLRLSHPDEYAVAKMLARFAVNRPEGNPAIQEECFRNLVINGRPRRIPENHNFWHLVEGPLKMNEKPSNVLDFDFSATLEEVGCVIAKQVQFRWRMRALQLRNAKKIIAVLVLQAAYITGTPAWRSATAMELKRVGGRWARVTVEQYRGVVLKALYMLRGVLRVSSKGRREQIATMKRIVRRMLEKMRSKQGTKVVVDG